MCQKCERNDQPVRSVRLVLYSRVHRPQQRSSGYVIPSRDWRYLAHPFGAVGNKGGEEDLNPNNPTLM